MLGILCIGGVWTRLHACAALAAKDNILQADFIQSWGFKLQIDPDIFQSALGKFDSAQVKLGPFSFGIYRQWDNNICGVRPIFDIEPCKGSQRFSQYEVSIHPD